MKKFSLTLLLSIFLFSVSFSQEEKGPEKKKEPAKKENAFSWDKVFVGGNLGMSFGSLTFINVSPAVGYKFTKKFSGGVGITYIFLKDRRQNYTQSIYGGSLFGRYFLFPQLFLHGEYENLNGEWAFGRRSWVTSLLGGGGYRQPLGERAFLDLMILWNFNDHAYSPYTNPIIRMGVNLGL